MVAPLGPPAHRFAAPGVSYDPYGSEVDHPRCALRLPQRQTGEQRRGRHQRRRDRSPPHLRHIPPPQRPRSRGRREDRRPSIVAVVVWVATLVLAASLALGLGVAVYRGVCTWRLLKRTGRVFGAELERISSTAAEIEGQLARADASARKLAEAQERLSASRARLDVQRAALREARTQVARTFWFVPGR